MGMSKAGARKPSFGRLVRIALLVLAVSGVLAVGSASALFWYYGRNLPSDARIVEYQPPPGRPFLAIDAVPPVLVHAFLSAEDRNFFSHPGIDVTAILRAMAVDVFRLAAGERPIGASTITQQLVRRFLLNDKLTLGRKIREILLALRIERVLSKDRILSLYVNTIYFGCHSWGISEAARIYFGAPVARLTLPEAALIAGLPQAPSAYDPWHNPEAAKERRNWVIDRMAEDGYITEAQARAAKATPVRLAGERPAKAC